MCFRTLLSWIILTIACTRAVAQPYTNLVLEGGGIRGIAYAGALQVLEERNLADSLRNVAGTSVGAIVGCLISMGYRADELRDVLDGLKIQAFNDGHLIFFEGIHRMKRQFGWYRGDALEQWIGDLIAAKSGRADLTFAQLHQLSATNPQFKNLYITATNLTAQKLTVFSWHSFPEMQVKTAVRASISIPFYFRAVFLDSAGRRLNSQDARPDAGVYVDGGVLANYPLALFDTMPGKGNTLGLKLERPAQLGNMNGDGLAPYSIREFRDYVGAFYNIVIERLNKVTDRKSEAQRTIYISSGNISPKIRKLSKAQKDELFRLGREGAVEFLRRGQAIDD